MNIYSDDEGLLQRQQGYWRNTVFLPKERFGNMNPGPGWCGARGTSSEIEKNEVSTPCNLAH